ncbi:iron-sulfur cluster repair protein YtfE [Gynuella sp.]|uniref:iron-sulfur cluster repair protein YtfE n=1 Tax=Gynuella sp. TaxID=2969146 RepID=UPI003D0BC7EE
MNLLDQSVAWLARNIPGSTQIFHEFDLDFCCGGQQSLQDAIQQKSLPTEVVLNRLEALLSATEVEQDWSNATIDELIDHILERYHEHHRRQFPELIRLALRVEQVHGDRPDCPQGLSTQLHEMQQALESHMLKEENILFPMLRQGACGRAVGGPISVMRIEHDHHGEELTHLAEITNNITLPKGACNTWRALYSGLAQLRADLMQHIHLENNILFVDALEVSHGSV